MFPEINAMPQVNVRCLTADHYVYDLIYNPKETLLLKEAHLREAHVKNGLAMLHRQAELAWKYFRVES